jgi:hypothetical protein
VGHTQPPIRYLLGAPLAHEAYISPGWDLNPIFGHNLDVWIVCSQIINSAHVYEFFHVFCLTVNKSIRKSQGRLWKWKLPFIAPSLILPASYRSRGYFWPSPLERCTAFRNPVDNVTTAFSISTSVFCRICCNVEGGGGAEGCRRDVFHFANRFFAPWSWTLLHTSAISWGVHKAASCLFSFLCYDTVHSGRCIPSSGGT